MEKITIHRGDDTDFTGNQEIVISIDTDIDLTGYTAKFRFLDFTKSFTSEEVVTKELSITIGAEDTKKFPLGEQFATLWLYDENGKIKTLCNRIPVVVTNRSCGVVLTDGEIKIRARMKTEWSNISGKPQIDDLPERFTDETMRDKVNELARKVSGRAVTMVSAALIALSAYCGLEVNKATKGSLWNDDLVVTDVSWSGGSEGGVGTNEVKEIVKPMIDKATSLKRDITDRKVYEIDAVASAWTVDDHPDYSVRTTYDTGAIELVATILDRDGQFVAAALMGLGSRYVDFLKFDGGWSGSVNYTIRVSVPVLHDTQDTFALSSQIPTLPSPVEPSPSAVEGDYADAQKTWEKIAPKRDMDNFDIYGTAYGPFYLQFTSYPGRIEVSDQDGFVVAMLVDEQYPAASFYIDELPEPKDYYWNTFEFPPGSGTTYEISLRRNPTGTEVVGKIATTNDIFASISTNNEAFCKAVRDCPAPDGGGGGDPPWGEYATLGAAIAGIIAALKMTVKKIKCGTMPEITPTNGIADLSDFFAESNSSGHLSNSLLEGAINLVAKTNAVHVSASAVTLNDGDAATVTIGDSLTSVDITFAPHPKGGLRFCELYVIDGTATTDITFDADEHFVSDGDSFPACEAGINYYVFAEISSHLWKVSRQTLKANTTPTAAVAE